MRLGADRLLLTCINPELTNLKHSLIRHVLILAAKDTERSNFSLSVPAFSNDAYLEPLCCAADFFEHTIDVIDYRADLG
jgi:hypothetical protein